MVGGKALLLFDCNAQLVLISMLMFACEYSIQCGYAAAGRDIDGLRDLSYVAVGVVKEAVAARGPLCFMCSCPCLWFSWVRRAWSIWEGGSTRPSSISLSLVWDGVVVRDGRLPSTGFVRNVSSLSAFG